MKISGLSCETKKIFLVFLGHPNIHSFPLRFDQGSWSWGDREKEIESESNNSVSKFLIGALSLHQQRLAKARGREMKQDLLRATMWVLSSAQRVGFFNIGLGRVFDKIPGSGSGSGRVGVSKIWSGISGYLFFFRVFPGISGISGYFGYFRVCRVFLGISGFTYIY